MENAIAIGRPTFQVWRTIKLGTGPKTAEDFRQVLMSAGCVICSHANDLLSRPAFTASETETEVDLVKVSVKKLGFKDAVTYREVCRRAQKLGLELCPAEVGPQLRLQYKDDRPGDWLPIAMEPISDSEGYLQLFRVSSQCETGKWEPWLTCANKEYGFYCREEEGCFIFLRRK